MRDGMRSERSKLSSKLPPKRSHWTRVSASGLAILLSGVMAGCQSIPSGGTDVPKGADFCTAARAIYYSRHDTPPTIAQIREHNAVGLALKCKWLPAKKAPANG